MMRPAWLKKRIPAEEKYNDTQSLISRSGLNTVCGSALCPNKGECFSRGTATFMILGNTCTRSCRFCAVKNGKPSEVDPAEPGKIADIIKEMGLKYAVITSVTRDDLADGGSAQFADTVQQIHAKNPGTAVEVLIPDFKGSLPAVKKIVEAGPMVTGHNLETVSRLYPEARHEASYERSVELLKAIKEIDPKMLTKSGLMLGLGETREEIIEALNDLRAAKCDILTLGQYLQPTKKHLPVKEYISPETFEGHKALAEKMGFLFVQSGPFVRSSFRAEEILMRS